MSHHQKGSVIVILLVLLTLGGIIYAVYYFFINNPNGQVMLQQTLKEIMPKNTSSSPKKIIGDINRDGVADDMDKKLFEGQMGCLKSEPCWNQNIGKTLDGDNPLYSFDLDLNGDGIVDQKDLDMAQ